MSDRTKNILEAALGVLAVLGLLAIVMGVVWVLIKVGDGYALVVVIVLGLLTALFLGIYDAVKKHGRSWIK